jgi:hypothetical protein
MILEDLSNTSLVSIDILEPKHAGLIKDRINTLSDLLRSNPSLRNIYYITDTLHSLDKLHYTINISDSKKESLKSMYTIEKETLSSVDNYINIKDSDNDFRDMIMGICNEIQSDIDEYVDNINYNESYIKINQDDQWLIDIYNMINDTINNIDTSLISDTLFEFNSNGEMIPIE